MSMKPIPQQLSRCFWTPVGLVLFMLTTILGRPAAYAQAGTALRQPQVEIPSTQLRHITSAIVGQEYDLYVHLPRNYPDTTRTFPVLYLLDAQWDFTLATAIFGQQYYDGFVPGIVIVGITWGGENPNPDALRARDLTPTNIPQVAQSGNAPKFLRFIKEELIPFIASQYRVNTDRTLMGSSLGGLFTLYALFRETGLFQRYVLTSPALGWNSEIIYTYEKNYAANNATLPARLFMAIGDYEDTGGFQKFVDHLKSRNYQGLALETRTLENTGHSGTKAEGFTRGLQFVFARPTLKLAPAVLARYLGAYRIDAQAKCEVKREDDHLVLITPDNTRLMLFAETESSFYVKGFYNFVSFKKDDSGKVTGMQLDRFNGPSFLEKVN